MPSTLEAVFRRVPFLALLGAVSLLEASAFPAVAQTGTIAGNVEAKPAKYLPETVVYVVKAPESSPAKTVSMDQVKLTFVPHLLVVTRGDTVKFLNHDSVAHNVYSPDGTPYNLGTFKPGEERTHTFDEPGAYTQLCSIHPEMLAFVFVSQNPYAAAVDSKGHFSIGKVPPGSYQLAVWNSHLKASPRQVVVTAGKTVQARFSLKR